MNKNLIAIFEYLEREKGIKRDTIIGAIEEALIIAARKSIQGAGTISVHIDPASGDIEVVAEKEIVDEVEYEDEEILLEHALEVDPNCKLGESICVVVTPSDFGRVAAQTAKQVITQKLRSAERDVIHEEYRHRIHDLVTGTVKRIGRNNTVIVDLGKVEAILPARFYPESENYFVGDRVQALLLEVRDTDHGGAEVILSRSHPEMVKKLFHLEVPELADGTVEIKKIVRRAGYRTKMTVISHDPKVDPLGACVGVRGTRVKNIIRELNEKIDIVIDTDDRFELLRSLLYPMESRKSSYDETTNTISLIVSDEDYPIAIGKRGLNARLNGELIGCELYIRKESEYQARVEFQNQHLTSPEHDQTPDRPLDQIPGVNPFVVDGLKDAGFDTLNKILSSPTKELAERSGLSLELAEEILDKIRQMRA